MSVSLTRLALLSLLGVASSAGAESRSAVPTTEVSARESSGGNAISAFQTLALARLANALDIQLVRPAIVDELVRLQRGVRDAVHQVTDQLAVLSVMPELIVPDLTILAVDPLAEDLSKSSGYGWRSDPVHHDRRFHHGTDMRAKHGTPVVAVGDGVVTFCGRQGGYGNVIYVDHGGGIVTRYAHLQRIETKKHASLTAGQKIGRVGSSGRATGPHLHFEVRIDGRDVNPITAMTVGEMQRETPSLGRIAAFALAPELQRTTVSVEDRKRVERPAPKATKSKPVRSKRQQILW